MNRLFTTIRNISKIEELRGRVLFTLGIILLVRFGSHVVLPGIDATVLSSAIQSESNTLFGFFDLFVGGAYSNAAIFALGIMPYITSSIIFQLAGVVIPQIQKIQKDGEEGRRKINQWTRTTTVLIAAMQGWAISIKYASMTANGMSVVPHSGLMFSLTVMVLLTAGTIFLMWLGEQITDKGIGNGISMIIMINILARLPQAIFMEWENLVSGVRPWPIEIIVIAFLCFIIWSIIIMTQGIRKIPVQYAKRQVGRKVYGGQTQHIPLRINTAGVMPIIFAQSLMFIPGTMASFFPNSPFFNVVSRLFDHRSAVYAIVYSLIIIFFTYFYTAIVFSPREIADNMKKQGGFIPGIRPGSHTAEYIDKILSRITLPGSVYLALIAIMPTLVSGFFGVDIALASFFGGTSLLIMVGVILDLLSQIESHLMMRHYDGFMKSGRIKGRVSI